MNRHDVIILGAGAAGMFCAFTAGRRGRSVLLLDHAAVAGEKIRISGGGRCNFTNLDCGPGNFLSANPRFCISALRGYTPRDFLDLVEQHGIAWHEKARGQLFCDDSALAIVRMLEAECAAAAVERRLAVHIAAIAQDGGDFVVTTSLGAQRAARLVIATGGRSIARIGATGFAYEVAHQFGLGVIEPHPGLVPLIFAPELKTALSELSGIALPASVSCAGARFDDDVLFTHRGLSGPAVLQISSYWRPGTAITVDLAPGHDVAALLRDARTHRPRQLAASVLAEILPRRLAHWLAAQADCADANLAELASRRLAALAAATQRWQVVPDGTEGFRKAEVTVGGVDTRDLSSRDLQARAVAGLHFIGEAVDVTGHLGGHNFQWAWASAHAAGMAV